MEVNNQTRYNLHSKIRQEGFSLVTKKKTIYVFYLDAITSKSVLRLRDEFGYSIQTELTKNKLNNNN